MRTEMGRGTVGTVPFHEERRRSRRLSPHDGETGACRGLFRPCGFGATWRNPSEGLVLLLQQARHGADVSVSGEYVYALDLLQGVGGRISSSANS